MQGKTPVFGYRLDSSSVTRCYLLLLLLLLLKDGFTPTADAYQQLEAFFVQYSRECPWMGGASDDGGLYTIRIW